MIGLLLSLILYTYGWSYVVRSDRSQSKWSRSLAFGVVGALCVVLILQFPLAAVFGRKTLTVTRIWVGRVGVSWEEILGLLLWLVGAVSLAMVVRWSAGRQHSSKDEEQRKQPAPDDQQPSTGDQR